MHVNTVLTKQIPAIKTTLNKMSKFFKSILISFLLFLSGCEKEDVEDIRDEFEGDWLVNENSSLLNQRIYEIMIFKDSLNTSNIHIFNFYKIGKNQRVFSTVSTTDNNVLTIPSQTLKNYTIEGFGEIDDQEIKLNYFINDGNEIDTVTAIYTKDNT